mmetsp:Transcript_38217/g.90304  ORF Transcript_38217/g.90304 Transcript_38217/m.90304 type:complete len:222 (+) Transcript_38217:698-1363(+)
MTMVWNGSAEKRCVREPGMRMSARNSPAAACPSWMAPTSRSFPMARPAMLPFLATRLRRAVSARGFMPCSPMSFQSACASAAVCRSASHSAATPSTAPVASPSRRWSPPSFSRSRSTACAASALSGSSSSATSGSVSTPSRERAAIIRSPRFANCSLLTTGAESSTEAATSAASSSSLRSSSASIASSPSLSSAPSWTAPSSAGFWPPVTKFCTCSMPLFT